MVPDINLAIALNDLAGQLIVAGDYTGAADLLDRAAPYAMTRDGIATLHARATEARVEASRRRMSATHRRMQDAAG